jgi:SMI1-KNR4 cell-wall
VASLEFHDSPNFTGPDLTDEMIAEAERVLGVRLPVSYLAILRVRNGGKPLRHCHPTAFPTSWAPNHIDIGAIRGIGGTWGIDNPRVGSAYLIKEWGYPDIGIVICRTPSGGHDTVMLDYSVGPEPAVVYVDAERVPRRIAATFDEFVANLTDCDAFER